jgi:asparagine synthase (glutamine-hydrolysing)
MCGIFGVIDWRGRLPDTQHLARATNLLTHRGPDAGAYWTEGGAFLGHRRLSIVDLASGDQPMVSADSRYVLTFNGEVYNFPELRDELRGAGVSFRTSSDTEVLVEGYAVWGADVIARIQGMFAFALYDRAEKSILLARDRFGEKPLLFAADQGRLMFASELAPLAALRGQRELDVEALGGYLCLNYVPGEHTLLAGVSRVAPATWQRHHTGGAVERREYWNFRAAVEQSPPPAADEDVLLDDLQHRIDEGVRLTLRSDVPVGLFLSGGTDSAIVAESAARQGALQAAFCVDVDDPRFSEWELASAVAKRIGVPIARVPVTSHEILARFSDVAAHLDDPLADSSAIAVWAVSEAASREVKVVLSGDGADELFGGYLTYSSTEWHRRLTPTGTRPLWALAAHAADALPARAVKLKRMLRAMPLDTREAHFAWNSAWTPSQVAGLVSGSATRAVAASALARVAAARLPPNPTMQDLQLADLSEYLPNDILAKVDRATMAHGLESRAPLLHGGVPELALTVPRHLRATGRSRTKILLRRLCERHFGSAHAYAPKRGFSIPMNDWLRSSGRALLKQGLDRDRVSAIGVLNATAVADAVHDHLTGRRELGAELWGLMTLIAWYEQRVIAPPRLDSLPVPAGMRAVHIFPLHI